MFKQISLICIIILFLMGCSNNLTLKDTFTDIIKKDSNVQKYTILSEERQGNIGIVFYQSTLKENEFGRNQSILLRVFNKEDKKWNLILTANCNDKWDISSENKKLNVYCGTIKEPMYTSVLIGDQKVKIFKLKNSNYLKAWYYINSDISLSIIGERIDGKKDIWQPASKKKQELPY